MALAVGILAPDFELPDEDNKNHRLSDYRGKPVVLYFYPKDDTPGCTTEACNFRDDYSAFTKAKTVILGVSPDTSKAHKKFKAKYSIPFTLLADVGHKICDLYEVWGMKNILGRSFEGVKRTTFLIDKNGRIAQVFENVKPSTHSDEVIHILKSL